MSVSPVVSRPNYGLEPGYKVTIYILIHVYAYTRDGVCAYY